MIRATVYFLCIFVISSVTASATTLLDEGFDDMYNRSFTGAHRAFEGWEKLHPDDPEGPVFDAAAYLFSEFDRLRILQSQFFVDNHAYSQLEKQKAKPSPEIKQQFDGALARGEKLATERLKTSPKDEGALFSNVLRLGLHSNYLALIQKQDLPALSEIKGSTQLAEELIQLHPSCYDAYIAIGIENYLLSLKPAPLRWLLQVGGAQVNKQLGIEKLRLTAEKGHYLQPYAELLLAVAALRDKNDSDARRYLTDLTKRFPDNELYRTELQKIP
ncbi:MAG TPA: hypothetical protein VHZ55_17225 [Bryobacteraceae bacterium]|jgi:hypothetical protein|nr:hypothetical protein [Bryobacteraceae bacterium]